MKRSTAIVAAVLAVVVVVAAIGGWWLLNNPPGDSGGNGGGTIPDDTIPSGPEGSVNGAVINVALNQSNASAYDELLASFNSFADSVEDPDALVQIAVSNNMTEDIELNLANFTAGTDGDEDVQALNTNIVTIEPNTTAYAVLGFQASGANLTSVTYTGDDIELAEMTIQSEIDRELMPPMMMEAPTNLTQIDNLTFEAQSAWRIEQGGLSPIPLYFNESENVILALVVGQNNNTTAMELSGSSFWLELANGTWVQAEETKNHALPSALEPETTKPFLIGFRVNSTVDDPQTIHFWPDQGSNATVSFDIMVEQAPEEPGGLAVSKVWSAPSNNTTGNVMYVELVSTGDGPQDVEVRGWALREGQVNGQAGGQGNNTTGSVYTFELDSGDRLQLLQYEDGGQTRYLWLRPLVAP